MPSGLSQSHQEIAGQFQWEQLLEDIGRLPEEKTSSFRPVRGERVFNGLPSVS